MTPDGLALEISFLKHPDQGLVRPEYDEEQFL
jgi:hypothetical protein